MIGLEGKLINVFTQEGGTNKKASRSTSVTKFRLWVQLNFPMGTLDTNYLRLALTMGETMSHSSTRKFL